MQKTKKFNATRIAQIGILVMAIGLAAMGLFPLLHAPEEKPPPPWTRPMPMPEYIGADLGIINYVDDELATVFIDKAWAGNSQPLAYTSGTCCVNLPTHWTPGMKMLISWRSASMYVKEKKPPMAEREVEVLPYEPFHAGYVWAIFLPGGEIRVQPSNYGPGAAGFLGGLPRPSVATQEQVEKFIRDSAPRKGP